MGSIAIITSKNGVDFYSPNVYKYVIDKYISRAKQMCECNQSYEYVVLTRTDYNNHHFDYTVDNSKKLLDAYIKSNMSQRVTVITQHKQLLQYNSKNISICVVDEQVLKTPEYYADLIFPQIIRPVSGALT